VLLLRIKPFSQIIELIMQESHLYGEAHGEDKIIEKELEIWKSYYQEKNLRHLFIESPYYTAELLNLWMNEDNNEILNEI